LTRIRPLAFVLLLLLAAPMQAAAQWGPWGYPYPYYQFGNPESNLRLKITPRDARVYVDGYFAGQVDNFDGTFERLHVAPGQHEIIIYKEGFRSRRERLYLSANTTRTLQGELEPLAAGETQEPPPAPLDHPEVRDDDGPTGALQQPPRPAPPRAPGRAAPPSSPPTPPAPSARTQSSSGTLSIRVQPDESTVLVDGERWVGPADNERLIVQVAPGRHKVEVQREGYAPFVTEVEVTPGQTVPVNISLTR
jgi:hypothetical protein